MNGKAPLYLTALAAVLLAGAVLILQPYSVRSPWRAYSKPVQRYLRDAVARDSLALSRQSVDARPVAWALAVARSHPDTLAVWAREAKPWAGHRHADTTDVFVSPPAGDCSMVLRFVGRAEAARVERASAHCLDPR